MLIFPIYKALEEGQRVFARLTEKLDREGDSLDYAASAPVIKAWSQTQHAASGGLSFGNVRGQHNPRIAAGRVVNLEFDDVAKTVDFEIEVVDPDEWAKVQKGVYTGISPGGKGRRYLDQAGTKRLALTAMMETSLVDFPAQADAVFTVVKAAGGEEPVAFAEQESMFDIDVSFDVAKALSDAAPNGEAARDAVLLVMPADNIAKAFGEGGDYLVSGVQRRSMALLGEAMPDGSWPVLSQRDLDAAVVAVEKATGASDDVRAHLVRRAEELSLTLPAALTAAGAVVLVQKGMGQVAEFASLISDLRWLASSVTFEAAQEDDGSTIPARLAAWLATGAQLLTDMAGEESAEAVADLQTLMASLPTVAAVAAAVDDDDVAKAFGVVSDQAAVINRLTGSLASVSDNLRQVRARATAAEAEIEVLKAMPAGGGPRLFNVPRENDGGAPPAADQRAQIAAMPDGIEKARALLRHNLVASLAG